MNDLSTLSDEGVIVIVRTKNSDAYAEVIKRYQAKLVRYANQIMGDEHMAADVVQDAFIKAYINLHAFDSSRKFSSWIYRIVHNVAMNSLPKHRREQALGDQTQFDSGLNLENELLKKELIDNAHYCLEHMPILYSEPLSLHFIEEKTYEEISDILRITIGTVGTRINRAKGIMRKLCQEKH